VFQAFKRGYWRRPPPLPGYLLGRAVVLDGRWTQSSSPGGPPDVGVPHPPGNPCERPEPADRIIVTHRCWTWTVLGSKRAVGLAPTPCIRKSSSPGPSCPMQIRPQIFTAPHARVTALLQRGAGTRTSRGGIGGLGLGLGRRCTPPLDVL
jgi:hypothetical protein